MYPSVLAMFMTFTQRFEGYTRFMYLDDEGLVTVGDGNLIDDSPRPGMSRQPGSVLPFAAALALQWTKIADGSSASTLEVRAEWYRVKGLQAMRMDGGGAFGKSAQLLVTQASLAKLVSADLAAYEKSLIGLVRVYPTMPADGQLATIDMAWAMGGGFPVGYPKWLGAVLSGEWETAAAECAITHPVNDSIKARNAANATLFRNAGRVEAADLPGDVVYWPRDLTAESPAPAGGA